jgi:hypothetical protein
MLRRTILLYALLAPGLAMAQTPTKTGRAAPVLRDVRRNDPLRKTLLDAVRPVLEDAIGAPVLFTVKTLRVAGRYAYFLGESRQANGRPFDFRRTKLKDAVEEGLFDGPRTSAYLERVGDGGWVVREWQIGSTDFPDPGWPETHGGPIELVVGRSRR